MAERRMFARRIKKMEEKKPTDEEIVNALYCLKGQYISYIDDDDDKCKLLFVDDILNLIYRLQDEKQKVVQDYYCEAQHCDIQKDIIEKQKSEIERLKEQCSKSSYKDSWKNKFFKAQEEIERLTEEKELKAKNCRYLLEENSRQKVLIEQMHKAYFELQKQVDELKDERENMQAEIMRFEDMKFTQEHCNLYEENEALKQWLKRLNADLEYEKNWGKQQTEQAVKDTAKEIFEWLEKHCFFNGFEIVETYFRERYGVEVE
jgi:hypothetical protein